MILEAWRWIFQGFWELLRNHRKQHDATGKTAYQRRAQRASERSERSERSARSKRLPDGCTKQYRPQVLTFSGCHSDLLKRTALPVPCQIRFILGWFCEPKRAKTHPRRAQTRPRRAKMRQGAPSGAQDGPKTPQEAAKRRQDAPKTPQDAPRAAQDGHNDAKIEPIWHQN